MTTQSFSFKPVDPEDEEEKSNIGVYIGVVAVLAASIWYFTFSINLNRRKINYSVWT